MADCGCHLEIKNAAQRRTLRALLMVNAAMFGLEVAVGTLAQSTALVADSLDMLADATVYGISFYAVGRSPIYKTRAAFSSGILQVALASLVLLDVIRKFISGSAPEPAFMIGVGLLALVANVYCLSLLASHRSGEVHMRSSWIFSKNDVIANLSIVVAGLLVRLLQSPIPDLVIGLGVAVLVLRGGLETFKETRREKAQ